MTVVLERAQRLSRSRIWSLQRRYFERTGMTAWGTNTVPHYITNTPLLADRYIRVAAAFLRDLEIDLAHPVYVVELGAGTGRFAYHVVRAWDRLIGAGGPELRYVLTDFHAERLAEWRSLPSLQPLLEHRRVDLACFDAERDHELALSIGGERITPGTSPNPIIVIANYVFDSLPQDCFYLEGGALHEALVTTAAEPPVAEPDDPSLIERVSLHYERGPACAAPYGEPLLDEILDGYRRTLASTTVTLPSTAVRCLHRLAALSSGRMLVLAADNGCTRAAQLAQRFEPAMTVHGSFSMPVNLHAIGESMRARGGEMFSTAAEGQAIQICAFALGGGARGLEGTRTAFDAAIDRAGPDRFYVWKTAFAAQHQTWPISQLVEFVKASEWDPNVLTICLPRLTELAAAAAAADDDREAIREAVARVWAAYVPIGESADLAFGIGVLLAALACWTDAAAFFRRSIAEHGPDLGTVANLAFCEHRLGRSTAARQLALRVLATDPEHAPARALLTELRG